RRPRITRPPCRHSRWSLPVPRSVHRWAVGRGHSRDAPAVVRVDRGGWDEWSVTVGSGSYGRLRVPEPVARAVGGLRSGDRPRDRRSAQTVPARKRKTVYPPPRNAAPRPPRAGEPGRPGSPGSAVPYARPTVASINLSAGAG